ncbi:hypothetical protein PV729_45840 [Streptomyces europaeiscabiei]|uniref:Uncharacterized protein n=1 Tax=Streptomyces europaeiscabiei TaxID=146819 RepID=A0ABU4NUR2_9ACTN|nr:hypothetical protein [Streptomyces europaeiscabiei]MDX3548335.1 hypothetical protein [Streptomyces europaeiscabiei]MDX3558895.1 hypothetical protein [Streptomyces europaeiscabiei]MDX3671910.1 hypothetical protein [Streptomyces europaeiscabiei]MDX3705838.1 hypothetical protein [Streptomyces europaeiscabiei]
MSRRCARWSARPSATSASPRLRPPVDPSADPVVAAGRQLTDDLFTSAHAIGELMLEVAPAYLSDTEAATGVLALLCEQNGEPIEHGLAARRYAMSGDRRALHGTVL